MDTSLADSIDKWIEGALASIAPGSAASKHIDELVRKELSPAEAFEVAIDAYSYLVRVIKERGTPIKPTMNIPLIGEEAERPGHEPTSLEEVLEDLAPEPPLLSMVSWEASRVPIKAQEYKSPLGFEIPGLSQEGVILFYRRFRGENAIANDWGFSTVITAEYYPG